MTENRYILWHMRKVHATMLKEHVLIQNFSCAYTGLRPTLYSQGMQRLRMSTWSFERIAVAFQLWEKPHLFAALEKRREALMISRKFTDASPALAESILGGKFWEHHLNHLQPQQALASWPLQDSMCAYNRISMASSECAQMPPSAKHELQAGQCAIPEIETTHFCCCWCGRNSTNPAKYPTLC